MEKKETEISKKTKNSGGGHTTRGFVATRGYPYVTAVVKVCCKAS